MLVSEDAQPIVEHVERILGKELFHKLESFAIRLASTKADLFVFIARKAVCMIDLFQLLDWPIPRGFLISDRVIEFMDPQQIAGKNIVVVDDIVIAGTTFNQISNLLKERGANSVTPMVAAVNTHWLVDALYKPTGQELLLSDQDSAEYCSKLVNAIIAAGRPYADDFPLFRFNFNPINMNAESWELPGCEWEEVTNNFHYSCDQLRGVVHVDHRIIGDLFDSLGYKILAEQVAISKIRLYASNSTGILTVMPVVTFDHLSLNLLQHSIENFLKNTITPDELNAFIVRLVKNPVLGHRILTYICSFLLFSAFVNKKAKSESLTLEIDPAGLIEHIREVDVGVCVGPDLQVIVIKSLKRINEHTIWPEKLLGTQTIHKTPDKLSPLGHKTATLLNDELSHFVNDGTLISAIGNCFLEMHRRIEIPSRIKLKTNPLDRNATERFKCGFTCQDIIFLAGKYGWNVELPETRKQLSRHLDRLIDRGVLVPAIASDDNKNTFRFYRPGEDIHFLDAHIKAIAVALDHAFKLTKIWSQDRVKYAYRIHIEKLLVGLTKLMYCENICCDKNEYYGDGYDAAIYFNEMGTMVGCRKTTGRKKQEELYEVLWQKQYFKKEGIIDNDVIARDFPDCTAVTERQQATLNTFALRWTRGVIGDADGAKRRAIILSSCLNDCDSAHAVFTDVDWCISNYKVAALDNLNSSKWPIPLEIMKRWGETFHGNRKIEVDNFILKYNAWKNSKASEIIKEIEKKFIEYQPAEQSIDWMADWGLLKSGISSKHPETEKFMSSIYPYGKLLWWIFNISSPVASFSSGSLEWDEQLDSYCTDEMIGEMKCLQKAIGIESGFIEKITTGLNKLKISTAGKARIIPFEKFALAVNALIIEMRNQWKSICGGLSRVLKQMHNDTYIKPMRLFDSEYVVWYDIKDSRCNRAINRDAQAIKVDQFRESVNAFLKEQSGLYSGKFCCCDGHDNDKKDEKYIFFNSSKIPEKFIHELYLLSNLTGVYFYMILCGNKEIDYDLTVSIENNSIRALATGEFREHFKGITEKYKKIVKDEEGSNPPTYNSFWSSKPPWPNTKETLLAKIKPHGEIPIVTYKKGVERTFIFQRFDNPMH